MGFNIMESKFYEKLDKLIAATYASGARPITDPTGPEVPGSKVLVGGDVDAGIYDAYVQPSGFGLINDTTPFSNNNLCSVLGLGGTNEYGDPVWMKYSFGGDILFVPQKPLSRSIAWNEIYDAGCVFGTDDQGTLPPNGRAGTQLEIVGNNQIKNNDGDTTADPGDMIGWLHPDATIGEVDDTIVMAGWSNSANNGTFEITAIDDEHITLDTTALVAEDNRLEARVWNVDDEVNQLTIVNLNGYDYKVRLLRGAADLVADYGDNRGARGLENEWVRLIMSTHIKALTGGWNYSYHDPEHVTDFGIGLTDADLITHQDYGLGSYTWTQEVRGDTQSYRRLIWGLFGASYVSARPSDTALTFVGLRPVLQLIP